MLNDRGVRSVIGWNVHAPQDEGRGIGMKKREKSFSDIHK